MILVTAFLIKDTLHTNRIETVIGRLVNRHDGSYVVAADRTVRLDRGHAYLTRSGALLGIRELITNRIDALNKARFQAEQAARDGAITKRALVLVHVNCAVQENALRSKRKSAFELWLDQRGGQ